MEVQKFPSLITTWYTRRGNKKKENAKQRLWDTWRTKHRRSTLFVLDVATGSWDLPRVVAADQHQTRRGRDEMTAATSRPSYLGSISLQSIQKKIWRWWSSLPLNILRMHKVSANSKGPKNEQASLSWYPSLAAVATSRQETISPKNRLAGLRSGGWRETTMALWEESWQRRDTCRSFAASDAVLRISIWERLELLHRDLQHRLDTWASLSHEAGGPGVVLLGVLSRL
jgi:hypothetical protein